MKSSVVWKRSAAGLVGAAAALFIGFTAARAVYYSDVNLPYGNSTGSTYVSDGASCFTDPYTWGHSLGYSVESFSNPSRIHFKYLDYYGGWTNGLDSEVDYRFGMAYLVRPGESSVPLNAIKGQSFTVYDVTIWTWVYGPHYSWVQSPFGAYQGNDQWSGSCSQTSYITFI